MTSQSGEQSITIYILPNMSQSKSKQTIESGQGIDYNKIKYFSSKFMQKMRQGD